MKTTEKILNHSTKKQNKKITSNVLFYFLITFAIARILVYSIPSARLLIKGYHVHHLNYGIILLAIVGYWLLINQKNENRLKIAKIYGIGLGLTFDEFGMWFHLQDNYPIRLSYDAIIIISAILINIVYFDNIWRKILKKVYRPRTG